MLEQAKLWRIYGPMSVSRLFTVVLIKSVVQSAPWVSQRRLANGRNTAAILTSSLVSVCEDLVVIGKWQVVEQRHIFW